MIKKNSSLKHLDFLLADLISLAAAFCLAYRIYFGDFSFINSVDWLRLLFILLMVDIINTMFMTPYSGILRRSYYQEVSKALYLTVFNAIVISVLFYILKVGARFSRGTMILTFGFYFIISVLFKYILKRLIVAHRQQNLTSLFIIGYGKTIGNFIEAVNAADFPLYRIIGVALLDQDNKPENVQDVPVIGGDYISYILQNSIDEVLIAVPPYEIETGLYRRLVLNGVTVYFDIDLITDFHPEEEFTRNMGIVRALGIGNYSFTAQQAAYLKLKRLIDILVSIAGFILLLPVCGIVKLLNRRTGDNAPILYTQKRVGLNGKVFNIYKFRSMVPDAESVLNELLKEENYRVEWEQNQKLTDDPRITKVGSFLRKTSLDELPQLINVLKGDMSLVGPRPLIEGELEAHKGLKLYQKVKPGITGWWGCNGRSNISYDERLELEYYYVKNVSLNLDILCLLRTIYSVLMGEGAQ